MEVSRHLKVSAYAESKRGGTLEQESEGEEHSGCGQTERSG